jgi:hypothetical protein
MGYSRDLGKLIHEKTWSLKSCVKFSLNGYKLMYTRRANWHTDIGSASLLSLCPPFLCIECEVCLFKLKGEVGSRSYDSNYVLFIEDTGFSYMYSLSLTQCYLVVANPKSQSFTITCVDLSRWGGGAGKSKLTKLHNYLCKSLPERRGANPK